MVLFICWLQDLWLSIVRAFRRYRMFAVYSYQLTIRVPPSRVVYARCDGRECTYYVQKYFEYDPTLSIYTLSKWLHLPDKLYLAILHKERIHTFHIDFVDEKDLISGNPIDDVEFSALTSIGKQN
jgi:hypothetical protein